MTGKTYKVELTELEIVALVSEAGAIAHGRKPWATDSVREVLKGAVAKLAGLDCGHGYTVMDSCPMCDADEDKARSDAG